MTSEFKRSQSKLEDLECELVRCESALASSREIIQSKEIALSNAQRSIVERDASLRERDAQLAALEARHAEALSLTGQQVAAARESRDEELERFKFEAESGKAMVTADYESQLARAKAAEGELRSGTQHLREENETLRFAVQRAEQRTAEAELSAQRAVSKFEAAVGTLRQLEEQYESLSKDAEAADKLRSDRILALETEIEGLRVAKASLAQERDEAMEIASQHAQQAFSEAREAISKHQRAELAAGDATASAAKARKQLEDVSARCSAAETEAAKWKEEALARQGDLERQRGAYSGAQAMLEGTKLALEAARREAEGLRIDVERHRTAAVEAETRASTALAGMEAARVQESVTIKEAKELADTVIRQKREAEAAAVAMEEATAAAVAKATRLESEVSNLQGQLDQAKSNQDELNKALEEAKTELAAAEKTAADAEAAATVALAAGQHQTARSAGAPAAVADTPLFALNSPDTDVFSRVPDAELTSDTSAAQKSYREDELASENAKLRQQLATFKLSLLSPSPSPAAAAAAAPSLEIASAGASNFSSRQPGGLLWGARGAVAAGGFGTSATTNNDQKMRYDKSTATTTNNNIANTTSRSSADDALTKARKQVLLAKEYLNQLTQIEPRQLGEV